MSRQKTLDDHTLTPLGVGKPPICTRKRISLEPLCRRVLVAPVQAGLRLSQPRKPARTSCSGPPQLCKLCWVPKGELGREGEGVSLGVLRAGGVGVSTDTRVPEARE